MVQTGSDWSSVYGDIFFILVPEKEIVGVEIRQDFQINNWKII